MGGKVKKVLEAQFRMGNVSKEKKIVLRFSNTLTIYITFDEFISNGVCFILCEPSVIFTMWYECVISIQLH